MIVQNVFSPYALSPYLDDLGFSNDSVDEHLKRLDLIMTLACRYGLTFGSKCKLFRSEVKFLGHVVNKDGVRLSSDRIEEFLNMPAPRTSKGIQTNVGLLNFCSQFKGTKLAGIMAPLTDCMKKTVTWPWPKERQEEINCRNK